jgi:hypothetical protein
VSCTHLLACPVAMSLVHRVRIQLCIQIIDYQLAMQTFANEPLEILQPIL